MKTPAIMAGLLLLAVSAPGSALAESAAPPVLAASCANCHGPEGKSPGAIPSIDGLDAETMARQLDGFRSGAIEATIMNRIASGYTDAEIHALVQYFTSKRP